MEQRESNLFGYSSAGGLARNAVPATKAQLRALARSCSNGVMTESGRSIDPVESCARRLAQKKAPRADGAALLRRQSPAWVGSFAS